MHRHQRLAEALERVSADVFLVAGLSSRDPDLAALLGPVHLGEAFLLATRSGRVRLAYATEMERDEAAATGLDLLTPADLDIGDLRGRGVTGGRYLGEIWARALQAVGLESGTLALAGRLRAGEVAEAVSMLRTDGWTVVPGDSEMARLRKSKSPWEIDEVRRAANGVCRAFRAIAGCLAQATTESGRLMRDGLPLTAGDLRQIVREELGPGGLAQPEGNIVSAGAEAGVPHTQGDSGRVLLAGESIVVDLYPKGHLFADCTRTFCVGTPPEALEAAHRAVDESLELAASRAQPGSYGADLQAAVCEHLEGLGYPTLRASPSATTGYVHGLGHGVGFDLHELPSFKPCDDDSGSLAEGDTFTLEPGLYDPGGGWGVRLENLYVMGRDGAELLTPLPRVLDPRRW